MTGTLYREQWEEPGYRISEHTGSPPVDPARLLYTVNHYPAVTSITTLDPAAWFRAVQRGYVDDPRRGYSLGYNWGYWTDGTEVEVRGWEYRNAANDVQGDPKGEDENRISLSFLIVVPGLGTGALPATHAQIEAVQARLADIHTVCGRPLPNIVHGDLEPTQCAGAGINAQTHAGLFLPPDTIPPQPAPEEPVPIILRVVNGNEWAAFTENDAGIIRWIPNGRELSAWQAAGAQEAIVPPAEFAVIVDYARTAGRINDAVTRITGITAEQWLKRSVL